MSSPPLIIAIDGPAGVGKSTVARALARRLGVPYLDTGAMYRAIALKVLEGGIDPEDGPAVEALAEKVEVSLRPRSGGDEAGLEVLLDGEPVGERIRAPEVSEATSVIATLPAVRSRLVALQQEGGRRFGGVVEGRDIGTRVFPDTPHKFFLDARPEVRARRRYDELQQGGGQAVYDEVARDLEGRDRRDSSRRESPLVRDETYTLIDTSDRTVVEVVDAMVERIEGRRA